MPPSSDTPPTRRRRTPMEAQQDAQRQATVPTTDAVPPTPDVPAREGQQGERVSPARMRLRSAQTMTRGESGTRRLVAVQSAREVNNPPRPRHVLPPPDPSVNDLPTERQPVVATGARPMTAEPTHIRMPMPTTRDPDTERALLEEQQVAQIEVMMLKGVRDARRISALLGIHLVTVNRLVDRVHARWEIVGTGVKLRRYRGESLIRLNLIENELWVTYQNTEDVRAKIVIMKEIIGIQNQRNLFMGLDKESVDKMNQTSGDTSVSRLMARQEGMTSVAARFVDVLRELRQEAEAPKPGQRALDLRPTSEILQPVAPDDNEIIDMEAAQARRGWQPSPDEDEADPPWDWEQPPEDGAGPAGRDRQ